MLLPNNKFWANLRLRFEQVSKDEYLYQSKESNTEEDNPFYPKRIKDFIENERQVISRFRFILFEFNPLD